MEFIVSQKNSEYLEHYGRLGMKWYQHIYGDYQGQAKYAEKYHEEKSARVQKKIDKVEEKRTKKNEKYQESVKKAEEQGKTKNYNAEARNAVMNKKSDEYISKAKEKINKINNMSAKDIIAESDRRNKKIALGVMAAIASAPLGALAAPYFYKSGAIAKGAAAALKLTPGVGASTPVLKISSMLKGGGLLSTLPEKMQWGVYRIYPGIISKNDPGVTYATDRYGNIIKELGDFYYLERLGMR